MAGGKINSPLPEGFFFRKKKEKEIREEGKASVFLSWERAGIYRVNNWDMEKKGRKEEKTAEGEKTARRGRGCRISFKKRKWR